MSNIAIITKSIYDINGYAFECYAKEIEVFSVINFWGIKDSTTKETVINLSPSVCIDMITTKNCYQKDMYCEGEGDNLSCEYDGSLCYVFRWLEPYHAVSRSCKFVITEVFIIIKEIFIQIIKFLTFLKFIWFI